MIILKDRLDGKDLLTWKWTRGETTSKADFGDPTLTTSYALCLYDSTTGVLSRALAASIPAGDTCGGRPCWRETKQGFKYVDKEATPGGVRSMVLKEGLQGAAQITLKAMGVDLQMPSLPLEQDTMVTVQLKIELGICWSADYASPALRNEQGEFRDKSD